MKTLSREGKTFTLDEFDAAFGEAKLELIDGRIHFGDDAAKRAFLLALGAQEIARLLGDTTDPAAVSPSDFRCKSAP